MGAVEWSNDRVQRCAVWVLRLLPNRRRRIRCNDLFRTRGGGRTSKPGRDSERVLPRHQVFYSYTPPRCAAVYPPNAGCAVNLSNAAIFLLPLSALPPRSFATPLPEILSMEQSCRVVGTVIMRPPVRILNSGACTASHTTDLHKLTRYHALMKADLRFSVKEYRRGKPRLYQHTTELFPYA